MEQHIHELLHVSAATLFVVAGVSALLEYRNLRERVVVSFGAMCLCSAAYAAYVVISHNLPKQGAFWMTWTAAGLTVTFGATFLYLLTLKRFLGLQGRLLDVPLGVQLLTTAAAALDTVMSASTGRSFLFLPFPREHVGEHQRQLGEGAYSLQPLAEVMAGLFMLSFVFGVVYFLIYLIRRRSRDVLLYSGLVANMAIVINDTLVAMSVFSGAYLIALSKAFEAARIHRDIHVRSRERIERRLHQAEKMEAIGRVTGGIAHDFRNVLTAVGGSVDFAAEQISVDHPAAEDLQAAQQGLDAGRRLVHQMLDVARAQETEVERVDVNSFFSDSAKFLSSIVFSATRLEMRVEPELGGVMIARGQLTQVLMNLVINACEAMPEGGTVEVRASVAWGKRGLVSPLRSRPEVVISVIDQGRGIPSDVLDHVFEPFFTTRSADGGSGLGLATLYSIVHAAGGHVEVDSKVGQGTRFDIRLPRCT